MNKVNNKGVTLIELIVSFAIVAVAIIYFFQTLYTVKTIYNDTMVETNKYVNKSYVIHFLNEYLSGKYLVFKNTKGSLTSESLFKNVCKKYHLDCQTFSLIEIDDNIYESTISGLTNGGYRIQNIEVTMLDGKKIIFPIKSMTLNNNVNTFVMPVAFIASYDSNNNPTGFPDDLEGVKTNVIVATNGKTTDDNTMKATTMFETVYNVNSGGSITIDYDMSMSCPSPNQYYDELTNYTKISLYNVLTNEEISDTCESTLINKNINNENRWINQNPCEFRNLDEGEYKIKVSVERNNNNSAGKGIRCGVYTAINSVEILN